MCHAFESKMTKTVQIKKEALSSMGINLNKILSQGKGWGVFSGNGSFLKEKYQELRQYMGPRTVDQRNPARENGR